MISVNLLSAETILHRRRSRRIRHWVVTVITTAVVSAIPIGFDLFKTARASAVENDLKPMAAKIASARTRLDTLNAQYQQISTQIARADALRTKRKWASFLIAFSRQIPEDIWLTGLETTTRTSSQTTSTEEEESGPKLITLDGPTGLGITGYSLNHDSLYEFMENLKNAGFFKNVELTRSNREPVQGSIAVRFTLLCDWQ